MLFVLHARHIAKVTTKNHSNFLTYYPFFFARSLGEYRKQNKKAEERAVF